MGPRRRVLVTGASGTLGGRLAQLLASAHDVIAIRHRSSPPGGLPAVQADLLDGASVVRALEAARPEAVVHAATYADADRCQAEPDAARRFNVDATAALARLCRARGLRLVALSTDLVLGGDRAWSAEDARARPLLVYGETKRAGEEAVLAAAPEAVVLRVPLVLGRGHGPRATASEAIAWALGAGRPLRLFTDQHRTPVDPESIADALLRVLDRPVRGLFHVGGPERLSRHELGLRVARVLGLSTAGIEAVPSSSAAGAPRPADTSLDSTRARQELDWTPRPLDGAIRDTRPAAV